MTIPIRRLLCTAFFLGNPFPQAGAYQLSTPAPQDSLSPENQVDALLAEADQLGEDNSRKALVLYSEALSLEGANSEILWLISRSYLDIGEQMPAATDEEREIQLSMYEKAVEFATKSVDANPLNSMAYTYRAMANAHIAPFRGFWESTSLMKDVRGDLERSLALDDSNHLAHFVYGRAHLKVVERPWLIRWPLGLGWGSRDEALRHFESAVNLKWDVMKYRLATARMYVEEEKYEFARAHLTLIPYLDPRGREGALLISKASELLQRLPPED
ncbi:MAG TPA: hypothetical protein VGA55_04575 [Bacteroidota bacterium]